MRSTASSASPACRWRADGDALADVIPAAAQPRLPVAGTGDGTWVPVRRIYCGVRNFADHAREMGADAPAGAARGTPVFFLKPADALVPGGGDIPYPPGTRELHHEVELVVALGEGARVFGYGIGLDLTRRDLQAA